MKTENNANGVQGAAIKNNAAANRTQNRPSLTANEAKKDEAAKKQEPEEQPKAEATNATSTETKADSGLTVGIQPPNAGITETGKSADDFSEAAPVSEAPKKFALNLEQTLKSVEGLHRLSVQRLALIGRIRLLEDFEVALQEESDELENNPYQGCKLIIQDDKRREFVTNTPNLIRMVAQFIFDACNEKLADIEANIIFPNA